MITNHLPHNSGDLTPETGTPGTSATRVGDRTPPPEVLGVSVSVELLTAEQNNQLQVLLTDIQHILDKAELSPDQLMVLSIVLGEALSIIEN